jgi:hypothetical protein
VEREEIMKNAIEETVAFESFSPKFEANLKRVWECLSTDMLGNSQPTAGVFSGDNFAPGDTRIPVPLGGYSRMGKAGRRKKRRRIAKESFDANGELNESRLGSFARGALAAASLGMAGMANASPSMQSGSEDAVLSPRNQQVVQQRVMKGDGPETVLGVHSHYDSPNRHFTDADYGPNGEHPQIVHPEQQWAFKYAKPFSDMPDHIKVRRAPYSGEDTYDAFKDAMQRHGDYESSKRGWESSGDNLLNHIIDPENNPDWEGRDESMEDSPAPDGARFHNPQWDDDDEMMQDYIEHQVKRGRDANRQKRIDSMRRMHSA